MNKIINLYEVTGWPKIPDHPHKILIVEGSGSEKANALLNFMNYQPDIDKISLYAKDLYELKCQYLMKTREQTRLKHFKAPHVFMKYSNDMKYVYNSIEECNPRKE